MKSRLIQRASSLLLIAGVMVQVAVAGVLVPVSGLNSGETPGLAGSGDSVNPLIAPNGRFVVFASRAENLSLQRTSLQSPATGAAFNVFMRDRLVGTIRLCSVNLQGNGGGNGDSLPTGLSEDGRFVLFESLASDLVLGDTNGSKDVFLRDLQTETTFLVSASTNGSCGNGDSWQSTMTPDGLQVVFSSAGNNLVGDDTNGIADIFVHDVRGGTTALVSIGAALPASGAVNPAPRCDAPVITSDGRFVAYLGPTVMTNSYPAVTANEVYVRDRDAGVTYPASTNVHKYVEGPTIAYNHVLSEDGRFIAVEGSSSSAAVLLRWNLFTSTADLVTTNPVFPVATPRHFRSVDMTSDGRFITYVANVGSAEQVYLWDGETGTNRLVSANLTNGPAVAAAFDWPVVDSGGRYIAFLSTATDLVTNAVAAGYHLYLRDIQNSTTRLIDAGQNGAAGPKDFLNAPRLTPDGRFLAFDCTDTDLVPGDNNKACDVFVCDLGNGAFELISSRWPELPSETANASVGPTFSVNGDGRFVAFTSFANNLAGWTNSYSGIFLRDLLAGTNDIVSLDFAGTSGVNGASTDPLISADGTVVVFNSRATNLVSGITNVTKDIFLRDLTSGATSLVSMNYSNTGAGNAGSTLLAMSADGRRVLYKSAASTLVTNGWVGEKLLLRSVPDARNVLVASFTTRISSAAMTSDGRFVAYGLEPSRGNMFLWDAVVGANVYTNITPAVSNIVVSVDGNRMAAIQGSRVFGVDRDAGTNFMIAEGPGAPWNAHGNLQFSADGRWLVYTTSAGQVPQDTNGLSDVYLYDFVGQSNQLISCGFGSGAAANGASDSPVISSDGRFIAYRSVADDIVPGDQNTMPDIFLFDRQTGTTTLLSASVFPGSSGNNRSVSPVFSGDGQTLVFQSWASDLTLRDFNSSSDLFAISIATSNTVHAVAGRVVFAPLSGRLPTLTWDAQPGVSYKVEFKEDLREPVWRSLNGSVSVLGCRGSACDLDAPVTQKFYRILASQ